MKSTTTRSGSTRLRALGAFLLKHPRYTLPLVAAIALTLFTGCGSNLKSAYAATDPAANAKPSADRGNSGNSPGHQKGSGSTSTSGSGSTSTSGSGTTSTSGSGTTSTSGSGTTSTSGSGTTSTSGSGTTSTSGSGSTSTSGSGTSTSGSTSTSTDTGTAACTLYVAANGSSSASGTTPTSALSLLEAARVAVAGDVVCVAPGTYSLTSTFSPAHSGSASAWITYTGYGTGAANIVWAGPSGSAMFHMYGSTFPNGPSYIEFKGLTLDGKNSAADGFFCQQAHHLKYINNKVANMAAAGIASVKCDYQTADHNVVYHNGYNGGWSSGISFNSSQWFDTYSGFHNVVSNNIVAGSYDSSTNHSDGNGIIMDLSNGTYTASTANTPAALIANNVVYGNGGRCIENFIVTNIWVVNNTCYDNALDLSQSNIGEIVNNNSSNIHYINNVVKSWNGSYPFQVMGSGSTGITYSSNLISGGSNSGASGSGFTTANPQFVNPPTYNATAGGQYANTISPTSLGNGLDLQSTSPAMGAGIDPTSLTGSNSSLKSDMTSCIYKDINGNARPVGGPFTLGAYQQ